MYEIAVYAVFAYKSSTNVNLTAQAIPQLHMHTYK